MQASEAVLHRWLRSLAVVPGAVLALLPAAKCPLCLAAYAGVLSSLGLGFLAKERVLTPLIGVFLGIGLASVGWSARRHRRWGPVVISVLGSAAVIAGRLLWDVPVALYGGVALLLGGSLWNIWLKRPHPAPLIQIRVERKGGRAS